MMTVITGGSKCGKSAVAEKLLDDFYGQKFYLATMQPFGQEAVQAIARHRNIRKNKHFQTIEKYTDIQDLQFPKHSAVLLECMGNLCANEMFQQEHICDPVQKILNGIIQIRNQVSALVIVTNQVGSDGFLYPESTQRYIYALGEINQNLAEISDNLIECVYGIPIVRKGICSC